MTRYLKWVLCLFLLVSCDNGTNNSNNNNAPSNPVDTVGLAACPDGKQIFSVTPLTLNHIVGWEPLGHMGPPGHTFPTDHQYLYFKNPDSANSPYLSIPMFAPSNIRITSLYKGSYAGDTLSDYSIYFRPCTSLQGRFGHVTTVSAAVLAAAGPIDQSCMTYEPTPGHAVTQCSSRNFVYDAAAGEQIGTVGGGTSLALDWWLMDRRATPIHFIDTARFHSFSDGFDEAHIVPASDYFTSAIAGQVTAKIGRYDGELPRTVAPLGGTIAVDVDSTARGYWFNPNQSYAPESYHMALAPDYITPDTTEDFSIGLSQPDSLYYFGTFKPKPSGTVNRAFELIKTDGHIYCYEPNPNNGIILLQLIDAVTLRLEIRHTVNTCAAAGVYQFTVGKTFDYKR